MRKGGELRITSQILSLFLKHIFHTHHITSSLIDQVPLTKIENTGREHWGMKLMN